MTAWARLSDVGFLGVHFEFESSVPALAATRFVYEQHRLSASLHGQLLAVSDGGRRLQLGSEIYKPVRKWFRVVAWTGSDGRTLDLAWRSDQLLGPDLLLLIEPGSRRYSIGSDQLQRFRIGTSVSIVSSDPHATDHFGAEMIGLLTYAWAMFERDRRATA